VLGGFLDRLDVRGRWALLKLVGGAPRVGVSARLAKTALAQMETVMRKMVLGRLPRDGGVKNLVLNRCSCLWSLPPPLTPPGKGAGNLLPRLTENRNPNKAT
jgi:hypothetical protein